MSRASASGLWWAVGLVLGCGDGGAPTAAAPRCAWGDCAGVGPRCVMTGIADGSWLTADIEDRTQPACAEVPRALRLPSTPGLYGAGDAPIGELRCEGMRPGEATVRVQARARMLTADNELAPGCDCPMNWNVVLRVSIDGQPTRTIAGVATGGGNDPGCYRGPNLDEGIQVTVADDGRLRATIALERCDRPNAATCLFLRGTGVEVTQ